MVKSAFMIERKGDISHLPDNADNNPQGLICRSSTQVNERLVDQEYKLTDNQKEIINRTINWAQNFFEQESLENRRTGGGHGFDHNQRVAGMAVRIAIEEGYSPFLPFLTALVFDVGRTSSDPRAKNWKHGELSQEMSKDFLTTLNLTVEELELISNAIEDHPKLNKDVRISWLVKILMDADRLDMVGAFGPLRSASFRPEIPLVRLNECDTSTDDQGIKSMLQDIVHRQGDCFNSFWTESAKKIAIERKYFHDEYIQELHREAEEMYEPYRKIMGLN